MSRCVIKDIESIEEEEGVGAKVRRSIGVVGTEVSKFHNFAIKISIFFLSVVVYYNKRKQFMIKLVSNYAMFSWVNKQFALKDH